MNAKKICKVLLILTSAWHLSDAQEIRQDWTHFVRIAGHGLNKENIDEIIDSATSTGVSGIEVDNDITGRYDSFLQPDEKLKDIKILAEKAHAIGNFAFVYIAGLECITANADKKENTFFKDHPDWVQRDRAGRPAIFGGGDAFWIEKGDEDVWISPYAHDWRKIFMQRVREIAATGIDGVYVDIPYWMTHFEGWENTWASYDTYTVAEFKKQTGIDPFTAFNPGDFSDADFRRWVDFRIKTINDFLAEINRNVKEINPDCKTIAEIYPGIDESAVRVGADIYELYDIVDVITHEYSEGAYLSSDREPMDWFLYQAGMLTFRAFAANKPSWMLSYTWNGVDKVSAREAIANLICSQIMSGTNSWDMRGERMSGSNDYETRKEIYLWLAPNEDLFYSFRESLNETGIYFSPKSRNYFAEDYYKSYMGVLSLYIQAHIPFQIITPRNLKNFEGKLMILPEARCLGSEEIMQLKKLKHEGVGLVFTGASGQFDETGAIRILNSLSEFATVADWSKDVDQKGFIYFKNCPGLIYYNLLREEYDSYAYTGKYDESGFWEFNKNFFKRIRQQFHWSPEIEITCSPFVSAIPAEVDGELKIYITNFKGLRGKVNGKQLAETDVIIKLKTLRITSAELLPFLGEKHQLKIKQSAGFSTVQIDKIEKGALLILKRE